MTIKTCIRLLADPEQIERCKADLKQAQSTFLSLSGVYALLGNEVRLRILYLLGGEKELCPCDLSDILEMTIPAVSQHLRKLKEGRLIDYRREKQTLYYFLTAEGQEALRPMLLKMDTQTRQPEIL